MGYGSELLSPGNTGRTPEGRTSWQDALNQSKGYFEWCLKFLSVEELLSQINEVIASNLRNESFSSLEKRWLYLDKLRQVHESTLESIDREIERTERYLEESDIQDLKDRSADQKSNRKFQLGQGCSQ